MNKKDLTMLIMAKRTLDYQKDPNPDNWVTMKGSHVHLENGKIDGGAGGKFNGQSYKGTKKQAHAGKSEESSTFSKKYESKAREAVEYWVNTHYKNPSDKNIKESVDNVRSQMEHLLKTAERNLSDAKKTGKEELIKNYQDKYDEAKGTLEALNNYYDGGPVKEEQKNKSDKNISGTNTYVNNIQSAVNKRKEIENRYRELAYAKTNSPEYSERRKLLEEKAKLQDKIDEAGKNILKAHAEKLKNVTQSNEKLNEKEVEQIQKDFEFVKKHVSEDSGLRDAVNQGMEYLKRVSVSEQPKLGAPKSPKKKVDPASSEAQAKRQAIVDDVMKNSFVSNKVNEASKKLIAEANKDYGGDHETSVMLENVVKEKDGKYITLKIVAKDKTGKSKFPQTKSITFKV